MMIDAFLKECIDTRYLDKSKDTVAYGTGTMKTYEAPALTGWVCPVCGRGLSPYTAVCPCKNGKGWEITCCGTDMRGNSHEQHTRTMA